MGPAGSLRYHPGFAGRVMILHVMPAMMPDAFTALVRERWQALIVSCFGAGNLPNREPDWVPFIKDSVNSDIPVFLVSQSMHGYTDLAIYESSQKAMEAGAVGLHDMTLESSYVKLLKILASTQETAEIKRMMIENWAGEITN
jgi:L-asparaginase